MSNVQRRPYISQEEILLARSRLRTPQQQRQYEVDPLKRTRRAQGQFPPPPDRYTPSGNAATFHVPTTPLPLNVRINESQATPRRPLDSIVAQRVRAFSQPQGYQTRSTFHINMNLDEEEAVQPGRQPATPQQYGNWQPPATYLPPPQLRGQATTGSHLANWASPITVPVPPPVSQGQSTAYTRYGAWQPPATDPVPPPQQGGEATADWSSPFSVRVPPPVPPRPSTAARSEQRGYMSTPAATAAPPVPPRMNTLGFSTVDPFATPSSHYQPNIFGGLTGGNRPITQQQNPFPQQQDPASPPQLGSTFQTMIGEQNRQTRIFLARQGKGKHLPNFTGNPLDWPLFISQYRQTTSDCEYSSAENMSRLEKALRGEARQLVQALMILRGNSEAVIQRLEERYGRPEYIIRALVDVAKKTPSLREGDISTVMDFSAAVNNLVTTIEALNLPAHLQNPQLIKELVDKLSDSLKLHWGIHIMGNTQYNLSDFARWIRSIASAASIVSTPTPCLDQSSSSMKKGKGKKTESNYATLDSAASRSESSPRMNANKASMDFCPICKNQKHKLFHCETFKSLPVNDRWDIAKKHRVCFTCLSPSHAMRDCKSRACTVPKCNRRHNSLLHGLSPKARSDDQPKPPALPVEPYAQQSQEINGNLNACNNDTTIMLRVLPVQLYGPNGNVTVNAILDEASTVTLLSSTIATQLGLTGRLDPLRLKWTNGVSQSDNSSQRVSCQIGPVKKEDKYHLKNIRTVKNFNLPAQKVDYQQIVKSHPHFVGLKLHILRDQPLMLLLGQPHIHLTVARSVREGSHDSPVATETRLGWVLHGPLLGGMPPQNNQNYAFTCIHESDDELLHNLVKEQFTLDSIGIKSVTSNRSREDKEAEEIMQQITRRVNNRWETGLLWRRETGFNTTSEGSTQKRQSSSNSTTVDAVLQQTGEDWRSPTVPLACRVEQFDSHVPPVRGLVSPTTVPCFARAEKPVLDPQPVGENHAKPGSFQLPPSRETAYRRMLSLERKFIRNPEFQQQFQQKIDHYIKSGYARKLTAVEAAVPSNREWFLPVFAAYHNQKPGKLRPVWDAASKSHGRCLNDFLYTGPDLLSSLPGILLKFRRGAIAFSGDITEIFHQVRIRPEDWPAQRFLWRSSPKVEFAVFQLEVMMFGSVCSPYCAQYIRNLNAIEASQSHPDAADAILNRHYMDDYLESCYKIEEARKLIQDVTTVHRKGGFHISKWVTNSPEVLSHIPMDDRASSTKDLSIWTEVPTERALGLHWNPRTDKFMFPVNLERAGEGIATGERIPTKHSILRLIMLVWDPLGFLSHFMITARLILQHLWREKVDWDDEIPQDVFTKWKKWVNHLPAIAEVKLQRQYSTFLPDCSSIQLHVFADASEVAYAAVAYLRFARVEDVDVAFVLAKSRVAPLKPTTISRLELQAAHMAARMGKFIEEEVGLPITSVHYWADNGTVLKWIRNKATRFQQFVANRVGEIHEKTGVIQWRWVPTKHNSADAATRESHADLTSSSRWWNGPTFLHTTEENWPTEPACPESTDEYELELRKEYVNIHVQSPTCPFLPDINRFSKYTRLLRATACVLDYLKKLNKTLFSHREQTILELAERLLISRSQWEMYTEEMSLLTQNQPIPNTSKLFQLNPVLDDAGVMRFSSRLANVADGNLRVSWCRWNRERS